MEHNHKHYEYLIVGSGAGGATLARELSRAGRSTLVVERGHHEPIVGVLNRALNFYDTPNLLGIPRKSRQGVILWRTLMAGGSSMVACGNATPCLAEELAAHGITLGNEYREIAEESHFGPLPETLLSAGSRQLRAAADELGYTFQRMPKFIDAEKCDQCGLCTLGCRYSAQWTALDYLHDARGYGADVAMDTRVDTVLTKDGQAIGVQGSSLLGPVEYTADTIIVAAGGLGTPVILQNSGIEEAGQGMFVDLMVHTYGTAEDVNQIEEPQMALVNDEFKDEGFILISYVSVPRRMRLLEAGPRGFALPTRNLVGLMTKINDDPTGRIHGDGYISKEPTWRDLEKLRQGTDIARDILVKAGADPDSIVTTTPAGAHPGGTAAIGRVVDADLKTQIPGLYVCDASVLPVAPGLPPMLTVMALAKRLSHHLLQ